MERSSTSKTQKIVIWFIIIAMAVGSIGAYFAIILQNDNAKIDQSEQAKLQKQLEEQQKQAEEEAKKEKQPLDGYAAELFDKAEVKKLTIDELKEGDGKAAKTDSTVEVNYFGWTSDGKIFDSTKKDGQVTPVSFSLNGVIKGWTEGLKDAKPGSIRKLTIPADKAYGETGSGAIGPNEPLMFIVEVKSVQ